MCWWLGDITNCRGLEEEPYRRALLQLDSSMR
jgi:hypothetical protein